MSRRDKARDLARDAVLWFCLLLPPVLAVGSLVYSVHQANAYR